MASATSIQWLPVLPLWLIAVIAAALLGLLAYGSRLLLRKEVPVRWVKTLAGLRTLIVIVLILCLLQPVLSFSGTVTTPPEMLVLIDTSQSMGLRAGAGGSRLDAAVAGLKQQGLAAQLQKHFHVHWFAFSRSAAPLELSDLPDLKPLGETTRFAETLAAARSYRAGSGPARVLLASDGNDLSERDVVETARRLGLIIDVLEPAGTDQPLPTETYIAQVQCAPRVLLGSETQFLVTLHRHGNLNRPISLHLLEDGREVRTQEVNFAPASQETQLTVNHRPTEIGLKIFEFRVGSNGKPYRLSVQVVDDKHEVLILEDTWRWEFKFLRRIFEDDPSFSFTAFLARGGNAFVHFGEGERRVKLAGFPQGQADLDGFDTIILGDVNPRRWPKGLATAIHRGVVDGGKALVLVAGPNLGQLAASSEINALLPVEVGPDSARPVEGPVEVRVSREGLRSPFFFAPSPATALPPLDQIYPPLRKRPAATVLLEAAKHANPFGNLIVVAEHTVGRGRVLFVGTDTLWKWQTLPPPGETRSTPYTQFWQQALRALAAGRPATSGAFRLEPDRGRYQAGQRVDLHAEVHSAQPGIQAAVVFPDDRRLPLAFAADAADPRRLHASFDTTIPGQYRIAATLTSNGKPTGEIATAIDVAEAPSELAGVRIDRANLERIAAATGGHIVDPADPKTWPAADSAATISVRQVRTIDLWNNFTLLLLLCGLLGMDWVLRLWRGYV